LDTRDGEARIKKSESVLRHHCGQDGQHVPMKALGAERRRGTVLSAVRDGAQLHDGP